MTHSKKISAFTLVELIVVIVVLAILAMIAFLSFSSQSSSARDSTRLADMSNIAKGLSINYAISGKYPIPDKQIPITASGISIGFQGYAGSKVLDIIRLSADGGKDPLDRETYYTYSTNASQSKFQILGFLEDGNNSALGFIPKSISTAFPRQIADDFTLISQASAEPTSYSGRFAYTKGDIIGILLQNGSMVPVQVNGAGIDIINTTGSYIIQYESDKSVSGTGGILKSGIIGGGLIGYWSFDEGNGMIAKDISGNGYDGNLSGTVTPTWTGGVIGGGLSFSGGFVDMGDVLDMGNSSFTISAWFNIENGYSNYSKIVNKGLTSAGTPKNIGYSIRLLDRINCNLTENCLLGDVIGDVDAIMNYKAVLGISNITLSEWHNVAYVLDRNTEKLYLYFDGMRKGESSIRGIGNLDTDIPFSIGALHRGIFGSTTEYFRGMVDEVRVYDHALSDSEVSTLYDIAK